MADQLRLRGGDTASSATFVGALREVTVDTDLNALRIHDGVTPGGHLVELSASAAASRSVVAVDSANNLEAVRAALQEAIDNAIAARDAADAATLASANSYTDTKVTEVLGGAPDLLDTLNELAEAIGDDSDFITTINASIAAVQADVDANEAAAEQARNDLNTSLQGIIDAIEADVDANEATAAAGDVATLASANAYTDTAISDLTNGADAALDTLKEIGDALAAGDSSVTDALTAQITTEATARDNADNALDVRIDALEVDPTTQSAVDAEKTAREAAIAAEVVARDAAIETEEIARIAADAATLASAYSYTDTQVAAGDAVVTNYAASLNTTEAATRAAADSTLSARLDVLEADPTTATALTAAVAGVQADVDQNEADADTAIAAEETRALAAEATITATHTADEAARNQLNLHAGLAFGQLYVGDLIVA
jgi:hypothetical protein